MWYLKSGSTDFSLLVFILDVFHLCGKYSSRRIELKIWVSIITAEDGSSTIIFGVTKSSPGAFFTFISLIDEITSFNLNLIGRRRDRLAISGMFEMVCEGFG